MSKNVAKASEGARDDQKSDFVLDFLYNDARRVGSFLSQFDESGHLQRIVQTDTASKSGKRGFSVGLSGGAQVLRTGASGGINIERGPTQTGAESLEREYDPLWGNALTLLDFLSSEGRLKEDIATAGIGQFVKISGELLVYDLATVQRVWDIGAVRKQMAIGATPKGNRHERRAEPGSQPDLSGLELGIEILKTLPHAITARLNATDGTTVWSSLRGDSMTGTTADLFLKHGARLAGLWTIVGVLDAPPDEIVPTNYSQVENTMGLFQNGFGHILDMMAPLTRMFLGRPSHAYGITPLFIFREVAK